MDARFKSLLAAGILFALTCEGAYAQAQIAGAPASRWTGWYAGINAGYAWGEVNASSIYSCPSPSGVDCFTNTDYLPPVGAAGTGSLSLQGFIGGAQIGRSWQSGALVFGIEADLNSFHLKKTMTKTAFFPLAPGSFQTVSVGAETEWLATARGRLGWGLNPAILIYATAGLALSDVSMSNFTVGNSFAEETGASRSKSLRLGWAVGAGVETALSATWSIRTEYLYVDFGSASTNLKIPNANLPGGLTFGNNLATSGHLSAHILRAGVNYRF